MKADTPLLSVILPVYNGADTVTTALNSILGQTGARLELIVVDDGSTDDSLAVVRALDASILCIQQVRQGPAAARNRGVQVAQGEFVSFLDADDCWPIGRVEHHLHCFAQSPDLEMVVGTTQTMRRLRDGSFAPYLPAPLIQHHLGSMTCRREAFLRVGGFNPELRDLGEDKEWFQRVLAAGVAMHLTSVVALEYRLRECSLTHGVIDHSHWFLAAVSGHLRRRRAETE